MHCPPAVLLYSVAAVTGYLFLASFLRFRRINELTKSLGYRGLGRDEIYRKINLADAQKVQIVMSQLEFPWLFDTSLQFALFRTYAIPSISSVLFKTRQLVSDECAGKRYADTVVLLAEFMNFPLDSTRASVALARMNFLHTIHHDILPEDILYTLTLFALQPCLWIAREEWRAPTELEKAAVWRFWYEVGIRMNLPAESIPGTFEDMQAFADRYEEQFMVPNNINNIVGAKTVDLLLYYVPRGLLRRFGCEAVYSLCDDRLRAAMKFPKPSPYVSAVVDSLLAVRRHFLRFWSLPRMVPLRKVMPKDPKTGRYFLTCYDNEPWYVVPSFWNRYGPWSWIARIGGWPVVGSGFGKEGYEIERVGPTRYENVGARRVLKDAEMMREMGGRARCPF